MAIAGYLNAKGGQSLYQGVQASRSGDSGAANNYFEEAKENFGSALVVAAAGKAGSVRGASSSPAAEGGAKELSTEAQRGIRSLEKRIAEHEKKLADFKANPTVKPGMEGQPKEVIEAAQQSRVRHLEKEIQTFGENIKKLQGGD